MNAIITANRKAVTGIAAVFLASGILAGVVGTVAPQFSQSYAANAAEVITGETPAIAVIVDSATTSTGVFK